MTTNGRTGGRNGTKPEDLLGAFRTLRKDLLRGYDAAIDEAMEKSKAIREAEAKFGNAGTACPEVRREGWLQRENPEDRKRYDAWKANRDRAKLTADHLNLVGGFAVKGQAFVLDAVEHLTEDVHTRPADVQPLAETLTNISVKVLAAAYAESLQFLGERGFQTIDQATPPGQH